ncbi:hypothetical protein AVEN_217712-1 [Araneus ventricosus]|uniref:Mariner Mos1 transposase n=1 Tax=Araneus ventricosus TaxID=182803 RepID=A0A4Y2NKF2_ARAVE|nr:hypothetical protein AVEN_217712-1 [Araneus ventricosus]
MLSDGVTLLHYNTHTARKTQKVLQKFKWEVWSHPPAYSPDSAPNPGSKHLSGTRFRQLCENSCLELAQWTGRDFCQAGLNESVLRSHKCLNRFRDYV